MNHLPKVVNHVGVPPIKCQGIKTKLVDFICSNISWEGKGRWVEPFLGSGVVLFNVAPKRALVSDSNCHIINLYKDIQSGKLNSYETRQYLACEGDKLLHEGETYYYEVRERFNETKSSMDFLFLNRSCFNGVMRFNKKGNFNVPFCRKPDRFRQAYITKIVNQIQWLSDIMRDKEWVFECSNWKDILSKCEKDDFVYLDPPYIGRHTDYFNSWNETDAVDLALITRNLPCGYALSMWRENKYRYNDHLDQCWGGLQMVSFKHFYHVGSTENLRNEMEEVLVIRPGYEVTDQPQYNKFSETESKLDQLSIL